MVHPPRQLLGSYIAAWSAYSVTTLATAVDPHLLLWISPTMVGVPAIVITTAYYKRRFSRAVTAAAAG